MGELFTRPVSSGPPDGLPLLGAVPLEQFGFSVDPLTRTLVPARVPMA